MTRRPLLLLAAILLALLVAAFLLWLWVGFLRGLAGTSVLVGQNAARTTPTAASRDFARPVLPASPDPAADQPAARAAQGPSVVAGEGAALGPSAAQWAKLRWCESRNTNADTGNGYYGYFQFDLPTWQSNGGADYPTDHTLAEQQAIADVLFARRGWKPWPTCGRIAAAVRQ